MTALTITAVRLSGGRTPTWDVTVTRDDGEARTYRVMGQTEEEGLAEALRMFKFEMSFDPPPGLTEEDKRQPIPVIKPEYHDEFMETEQIERPLLEAKSYPSEEFTTYDVRVETRHDPSRTYAQQRAQAIFKEAINIVAAHGWFVGVHRPPIKAREP